MKRVSFVGFEVFDSFDRKKINDKIEGLLKKFAMHFGDENLSDVKIAYKRMGSKEDHTVEIKLAMNTNIGVFRAEKVGHKPLDTIDEIVNDVSKQILTKKERMKSLQKPRNA